MYNRTEESNACVSAVLVITLSMRLISRQIVLRFFHSVAYVIANLFGEMRNSRMCTPDWIQAYSVDRILPESLNHIFFFFFS